MILISGTYGVITEESAEQGAEAESGLSFEDESYGFRALVHFITSKGYTNCSCFPSTGETYEWLTKEDEMDMETGNYTRESIHYSRNNKPRAAKYWAKAFKAAGIK